MELSKIGDWTACECDDDDDDDFAEDYDDDDDDDQCNEHTGSNAARKVIKK